MEPKHIEGYKQAEWVLMDYVDFVVHIFSESARKFYDLERLWKTAKRLQLADLEKPARKACSQEGAAKRTTRAKKAAVKLRPRAHLASAAPQHANAQEFLTRETPYRMDRQDAQFAHSIVDRRIPEAAVALRRQ